MRLTLHRGAGEIGGTCIEVRAATGERLILDAGRPLDAPREATGLLPATLDRSGDATVLVCHAHQDHWGLLHELPEAWPVLTGPAAAKLIAITRRFARLPATALALWKVGTTFSIGPFRVTPLLTDHSAFDAAMLLIEADGRRILYSGDFRRHGRKAALVDRLMAAPPADLDALILEGTNLGTDKPVITEDGLEQQIVDDLSGTPGRIFAVWSGQNIDRTVTLYRAARRMGRTLVVDLYTAEVLEAVAPGTRLPRPGFPGLKVVVTRSLQQHYHRHGMADFVARMARHGLSARALTGSRAIIMLRDGLLSDYVRQDVRPTPEDAFVWSTWRGYFADDKRVVAWAHAGGLASRFLHTSGHASSGDLRDFAQAMSPHVTIPVHGINWAGVETDFPGLRHVENGMSIAV